MSLGTALSILLCAPAQLLDDPAAPERPVVTPLAEEREEWVSEEPSADIEREDSPEKRAGAGEFVVIDRVPQSASEPRPKPLPIVTTASETRFTLVGVRANTRVVVDALGRTIAVLGIDAKETARILAPNSDVCVAGDVRNDALTLRCTTSRIEAFIKRAPSSSGRRSSLVVRVSLGTPLHDVATTFPRMLYAPEVLGIGGPCPGDTDAARAECALIALDTERARLHLLAAKDGEHGAYASLRLGDLALESGDLQTAALHYAAAGRRGPFGRLAIQRRCELMGTCREAGRYAVGLDALDHVALGVLTDEMLLRKARVLAFDDEPDTALVVLFKSGTSTNQVHTCRRALLFCQRLVQHAFETSDAAGRARAFAFFTTLPVSPFTPLTVSLTRRAAVIADEVGAPAYGAALLAGISGQVEKAGLNDHLRGTAELYLRGHDVARARLVLEYASEQKLTAAERARIDALFARVDDEERSALGESARTAANDATPALLEGDPAEEARAQLLKARARLSTGIR